MYSKIQKATQKKKSNLFFSSFFLFFNLFLLSQISWSKTHKPSKFPLLFWWFLFSTAEEALTRKEEKEEMYPRVKVRQQEDQDDDQYGVYDVYTSVEELEDVSPPSIAKIPKSYIPSVDIPTISVAEVAEKKNEKFEEDDNQQNIRASSIPRPRAVLSSPNNDGAIGNKNRVKTERPSVLKNHNTVQNRHALSKVNIIPSCTAENSMNMKKSKEIPDESNLKGKKGSAVTVPSQRRNPRTGKPSSIRT